MATHQISSPPSIDGNQLTKRVLFGAIIGFMLIAFFVFGVDEPNPQWGKYWMIRPLIVEPLAGAAAMAVTYFINRVVKQQALAVVLSVIVVLVALWLGIVAGLNGTMWN